MFISGFDPSSEFGSRPKSLYQESTGTFDFNLCAFDNNLFHKTPGDPSAQEANRRSFKSHL